MNAELEKWIGENQRSVEWVKTYEDKYNLKQLIHVSDLRELFAGKVLVPVELLHAIEIDMTMECTNFDTLNQLRSIIDKENT